MVKHKLKNIGILEIHYHVKFLNTMIRICKTKNTNVTIFTTEEIFSRLKINLDDSSKYDFILKKEEESISRFLGHSSLESTQIYTHLTTNDQ